MGAAVITIEFESHSPERAAEILPLGQACWNESTLAKKDTCAFYGERDFSIEPDYERYAWLAEQGALLFLMLRDDGVLRGYLIAFTHRSLHHRQAFCGFVDSVYIDPDYRSYTAVMVGKFHEEMTRRQVQIIGWPTHPDGPIYQVLKALGYIGDDIVMEKRLCV